MWHKLCLGNPRGLALFLLQVMDLVKHGMVIGQSVFIDVEKKMEFWGDVVRVLEVPCFRYLLGSETLNAILVVRQSSHGYSVINCVVCTDDDSKID